MTNRKRISHPGPLAGGGGVGIGSLLISCILQLLLSPPQVLLGSLNVSPCNLELLSQMGELRVLIDILILDKYTDNVPTSLMPLKLTACQ